MSIVEVQEDFFTVPTFSPSFHRAPGEVEEGVYRDPVEQQHPEVKLARTEWDMLLTVRKPTSDAKVHL